MRGSVRSPHFSRLAGAVVALWLGGAGSAWAGGGGGADAGTLQSSVLNPLCDFLGVTSCPQLPTINQIVLEISALQNTPPNLVRSQVIFVPLGPVLGTCSVAGNFSLPVCDSIAINAVNPPLWSDPGPLGPSPIALASLSKLTTLPPLPVAVSNLSSLTPLAFIGPLSGTGSAVPVPPGTKGANSFFYAATSWASGQPETLTLFYDYPPQTNPTFAMGQIVAKISLPLEVLNADGSERLVCGPQGCPASLALLQIKANCNGGPGCLIASVKGDFSVPGTIETRRAADLGLQFGLVFSASPNASQRHAIFVVQVPLLVTGPANPTNCGNAINSMTPDVTDCGNDPAYFGVTPSGATNGQSTGSPTGVNQASGLPTAFKTDDLGSTPAFLAKPVGIAPLAAPPCAGGACPAQAALSTFPFCASFWANGTSPPLHSAVAAFLAIGTDGTTYVSSPVPPFAGLQCPF